MVTQTRTLEDKINTAWSQDCHEEVLLDQLDREIAQVEAMVERTQDGCNFLEWPESLLCYLNGLLEAAQTLQECCEQDCPRPALVPQEAVVCLREADALMSALEEGAQASCPLYA